MHRAAALALALLLLAGCSGVGPEPPQQATSSPPPTRLAAATITAVPDAPRLLTWFLDSGLGMGPANATASRIALSGGSDPTHGRDVVQFSAAPLATPLWLSNFTVHLILDSDVPWTDGQDNIQFWFGYDGVDDVPTFAVQGDAAPLGLQPQATRFDVRINDTTLPPGGLGIPAGARPIFWVGVPGTQTPATPLYLYVGGERPSHVHPTVAPWSEPAVRAVALAQAAGTLLPDLLPTTMARVLVPVSLPADAVGFVAVVRSNSTQPADFDLQVLDAAGNFLAESNGPVAAEELRFYAANVAAVAAGFQIEVVNAGRLPADFWLRVDALVPA